MTGRALHRFLEEEACRPTASLTRAIAEAILSRHGRAVAAILFYGSGLRSSGERTGTLDFYVLAEDYGSFHRRRLSALGNRLIPPNVYHLETSVDGRPVRSKYAVLTLSAFERRASPRAFESLIWGRFSQPCTILFTRDEAIRDRLIDALAEAARTMLNETVGLMPRRFEASDIWVRALQESYRSELRAERADRALKIYRHGAERYDAVAGLVFAEPHTARAVAAPADATGFRHACSPAFRGWTRLRWIARRVVGKLFSVLRLFKAAFTFDGGLDYILGKIASHSGVSVTPTPWQRRHPLLAAPILAWRLRRRNAFR